MAPKRQLSIALVGTTITAICCFTPILVSPLVGLGLVGVIAWLDTILIPILLLFIIMLGHGIWRMVT